MQLEVVDYIRSCWSASLLEAPADGATRLAYKGMIKVCVVCCNTQSEWMSFSHETARSTIFEPHNLWMAREFELKSVKRVNGRVSMIMNFSCNAVML